MISQGLEKHVYSQISKWQCMALFIHVALQLMHTLLLIHSHIFVWWRVLSLVEMTALADISYSTDSACALYLLTLSNSFLRPQYMSWNMIILYTRLFALLFPHYCKIKAGVGSTCMWLLQPITKWLQANKMLVNLLNDNITVQ